MILIIQAWTESFGQSRIGSYTDLLKLGLSRNIITSQMPLHTTALERLKLMLAELLEKEGHIIEETCLSSLSIMSTSTLSTAAPTVTDRAGAVSSKTPEFANTFEEKFEGVVSSELSLKTIGSELHDTSLQTGKSAYNLKLKEPWKKFRVELRIWESEKIFNLPSTEWWRHVPMYDNGQW